MWSFFFFNVKTYLNLWIYKCLYIQREYIKAGNLWTGLGHGLRPSLIEPTTCRAGLTQCNTLKLHPIYFGYINGIRWYKEKKSMLINLNWVSKFFFKKKFLVDWNSPIPAMAARFAGSRINATPNVIRCNSAYKK